MANKKLSARDVLPCSPEDYENMLRAAMECYRDNELDNAAAILKGLVTLDPDDVRPVKALGSALLLLQRFNEAEAVCERAVELDPEDPYMLVALAELKLKSLEVPEAIALFEKLFAMDPNGEHPAANRGREIVEAFLKK